MDTDLKDLDLYGILEIQQSATEKQVKTAYRKKALQCHPDKNPDDPKAAQLFLQLSKILNVLTDTAARAAYDKLVNAKIAAKLREKEYDGKRKKFMDELLRKEKEALRKQKDVNEYNFEKELERLRKENLILLAKDRARTKEMFKQRASDSFKLKVKYKKNGIYNEDNLRYIFSKHGDVITVVILEDKKCALIEFASKISAINARNVEIGYPNYPLKVSFIRDCRDDAKNDFIHTPAPKPSDLFSAYKSKNENETENTTTTATAAQFSDYEAMILERFRQAGKSQQKINDTNNISDSPE